MESHGLNHGVKPGYSQSRTVLFFKYSVNLRAKLRDTPWLKPCNSFVNSVWVGYIFFAFFKIIPTFAVTNQIFLPFKGVWFLLRRAERLGSAKPWQPIPIYREKGAKT